MKFKRNLLILSAVLVGVLIVVIGCLPTTPPAEGDVPTNGTISVAAAAVTTNDATPTLTLSSTGATYMAFSGNGTTWSSWVTYATTYSAFNITTGEGCTSGDGTKTVYAKYKNDNGESATKVHDSILLDTVKPTLLTAVYTDVGSGGTVNASDTIVFTFDDEMDITTVTASTVKANLLLSASKSYGTSPTVSWDSTLKICTVTLGASPTIVVGTTTVNPSVLVKDTAGNTDNSSAVTISGTTTTVLYSVSISNSAVSTTTGGSTITLTAVATSTASTVMTSSCTFTWSLYSGVGSIGTGTTSTVIYTPPDSGTGTAVVKVSVIKTGTTTPVKTATASTITVSAATTPSTTADATKLFVSARTSKAKYTSLPSGATSVKVYSNATKDPIAAIESGSKYTINISDAWTPVDSAESITVDDYIYFTISYSDATTSSAWDGQLPAAPTAIALGGIQATGKDTATCPSAVGNVDATDKITLFVGDTQYCDPKTVGSTMALTTDLVAGNVPKYTRTNANGHESGFSGTDGKILGLTGAEDTDSNAIFASGDTIILTFTDDTNVDVTLPITASYIDWDSNLSTAVASLGTATLKGAETDLATVVLSPTTGCHDFDSDEVITFNIKTTIPIIDHTGGNRVLPHADGFEFDSGSF
jgi:hypothetical protein